MPDPFYDDYQRELPKKCFLTDSVGTKFGVLILKWELEGSFSEGIYNILEHYGLPDGAWLRMTYEGKGEFFINSVSDRKFKEVKYPVPPKFYKFPFDIIPEEYFSSMPPELQIDEAELNQPVNFDNLRTWEITLTSKQVTHNNMNLPHTMARDFIFMHRLTEVQILDEESRSFICVVARTSN